MARKVFISFLGFSNYSACKYAKDNYVSDDVRFVQEATIGYIDGISPWTNEDVALILLTEGAYKKNWIDDGQIDRQGNTILQTGLKTQLDKMSLPLSIVPVTNIPDGNDEDEIMQIFSTIFQHINDDDELFFDVTHGFRSLPMLMLVFGNYSKFLKHATIKSITYGNFEGRNKTSNTAQLVDLLSLSYIQDWTFAAADFLENGNINRLSSLSESKYKPILRETKGKDENAQNLRALTENLRNMISDFQTCRGMNIVKAKSIAPLKDALDKVQSTTVQPLNPVIEKIKDSIKPFDNNENVSNGFLAARWCLNNGLYQQAATILQENVVTFFAYRHGIDIDNELDRSIVNKAFAIIFNNISKEFWDISEEKLILLHDVMEDDLLRIPEITSGFKNLSEIRNDINHSGMRSKRIPLSANKIRENIHKCVELFEKLLYAN